MLRIQCRENWAAEKVAGFPVRWQRRILSAYMANIAEADRLPPGRGLVTAAYQAAGHALCDLTGALAKVRLPLDATDADVCTRAEEFARDAMDVGRIHHTIEAVRAGMESFVRSCQLEPPGEKVSDQGAIGRMTCRDWWRRGLRKMHAKAVEGAAIRMGYVNRSRDLYVSNESMARRQQQIKRNTSMMESTRMVNELEQEFTLAELAAKGTGNKAIRRGELMTRIAGFERIAVDCEHAGLFLTVTCPSRMHKWISAGKGKVFENNKYDGTTPREAQQYLSSCYSRVRPALDRRGIGMYGFRIAEPHHDGCPHWHFLLFCESGHAESAVEVFRRYFLADSPDEAGAAVHRVKVERIDWKRGTAAGYIAKYVAKNIDGLHVENDLYGNPAMETSLRVEAWASTWGIRQFQQIGGAPVGVWRELRRVKDMPEGAPEHLKAAHAAVNRVEGVEDGEVKAADWAGYVRAQGGVFVGRGAAIKIAVESSGEVGRYGEAVAAKPCGVETVGVETYRDGIIPDRSRFVVWLVQSVRHVWQVVKRGVKAAGFSPPWTGVNNCTRIIRAELQKVPEFFGGGGVLIT
ncbi:MAG: replication endonuclease [Gammaproteobacteria bacterium]|nr:replication endonuclease [Gammaproteobacteria bacterium]